ncbi:DUF6266 family protein [uncultured Treponema sp.]|uniref:DUF6266 family protein n=1 Tax=uncultured Treponema sp. TaxID=162155 RepID=UPI0025D8AF95|nr:DUF6266 family protein [uncultured Treponema sp.]
MGKMNTLKGNYIGKVGQTVGAKWKNLSTERVFTKPANPNTQAQQTVRSGFKAINAFVALFADQIRYKSALDTSGMSVRNAIVKLNKEMVAGNTFTKANLVISKGGLQKVAGEAATANAGKVTVTWTAPTATNFTENAKLVAVMVQEDSGMVEVVEAAADARTLTSTLTFITGDVDIYVYYLDKRGSNKIASLSDYLTVTIA